MNPQSEAETQSTPVNDWRTRNRFYLQAAALVLILAAPFGLYCALNAGQSALAAGFFAAITLGMAITVWAG
jgi:hypothetical protein